MILDTPQAHDKAGGSAFRLSIKGSVEDFVDDTAGNCHQYQVGSGLLPLISVVVRQPPCQATIELLGDAGWQRFATRQVLLDSRRQCGPWAPVIAGTSQHTQYACSIDTGAMTRPSLAFGMVLAMPALAIPFAITLALSVAGISQSKTATCKQREC